MSLKTCVWAGYRSDGGTQMKRGRKLNLGAKLTLSIAFGLVIVLLASALVMIFTLSSSNESSTNSQLQSLAEKNAATVLAKLTTPLETARTLAGSMETNGRLAPLMRRTVYNAAMEGALKENPEYLGIWACFEPNALDGLDEQFKGTAGADQTGRFASYWYWSGTETVQTVLADYETPGAGDYYLLARDSGQEVILEPFAYEIDGQAVLMTSVAVPVKDASGAVLGVVGVDITLESLQAMSFDTGEYTSAYFYAIANGGTYFIHADTSAVGENLRNRETTNVEEIVDAMAKGVSYTYDSTSVKTGKVVRRMLSPIVIGNTGTPWYFAQALDLDEAMATTTRITWMLAITFLLTLLVTVVAAAVVINRTVSIPVRLAAAKAGEFAEGDYSVSVPEEFTSRGDEIGSLAQAFDSLFHKTNELLSSIKSASREVSDGAKLIASSSEEMAQGATEQASAVEELSASIEEIASQTRQNAESAGQASQLADNARTSAETGNQQMTRMLSAMEEINESSDNISKIIKVIDDIAFQTNILALNAAVEAARAGEHGKGFSVVAQEVRNLAGRSASAAQETTAMIEASIRKVEEGRRIAEETARAMSSIVEEIERVAQLIRSINTASGEQSIGIDQINQGILQVSQVVQANSASAQQGAATSDELSRQAETLEGYVSSFKLKQD